MMLEDKKIGEAVRKVRKYRHMTQAQLASAVGMAPNSIAVLERGERGFTVRTLNAVASALQVPTIWLTVLGTSSPIKGDSAATRVLDNLKELVAWTVSPERQRKTSKRPSSATPRRRVRSAD